MKNLINKPYEVVACDPGQSGSIVRLGQGKLQVRRGFKTLQDIAVALTDLTQPPPEFLVVEHVHAFPGQGSVSTFSFGKSTGVFYGAVYGNLALRTGCLLEEVSPQRWQNWVKKELGLMLGAGEFSSAAILEKYLPELCEPCRKKAHKGVRAVDHNVSDAVLMGLWKLSQH